MTEAIWLGIDHDLAIFLVFGLCTVKAYLKSKVLSPFKLIFERCKISRARITTQLKAYYPACRFVLSILPSILIPKLDQQVHSFCSLFNWSSPVYADQECHFYG